LSVRDLAAAARVGANTVVRLEAGEKLQERTVEAIRTALEMAGVEFIAENGGGAGVRLKKPAKGVEEITQEIDALEDKISSMPAPTKPSPEAGMNICGKLSPRTIWRSSKPAANGSRTAVRNKRHRLAGTPAS
jgi:hypothetical protein